MKIAKLSEVKNNLSRFVEQVRQGEQVRILVRGVPAADLVPVSSTGEQGGLEQRLADMERRGLLRRGRSEVPRELLTPGPPSRGKTLSETLLAERKTGR